MKKFLSILCTVAMVAAFATNAFAVGSITDPFNVYDGDYGVKRDSGDEGAAPAAPAAEAPAAPAAAAPAAAAPSAPAAAAPSAPAAAAPAAAAANVVASIDDYTEDSLARILVSMLNSPADKAEQVYTSADVMKAMNIAGEDEKTVAGTPVDTSKLTVISKALDEKSTGATFTKKDDGSYDVKLNGNELTKDRDAKSLFIVVAPKAPISVEPKAYIADVEIADNVLTFSIPKDAAICITLLNE